MEKGTKILIGLVIIVIVIIWVINSVMDNGEVDSETMQCISDNSLLIVSKTCGHCVTQLKILGDNKDFFNLIYVDENPEVFDQYGLVGVPAWIIDEKIYYGVQSFSDLKQLTEC
jgi:hypothetical protein